MRVTEIVPCRNRALPCPKPTKPSPVRKPKQKRKPKPFNAAKPLNLS